MAQTQASERADARRVVGLFDKTMTGPVASLWVSSLNTHRPVRLSDGGTAQGGPQRTRFTITRTGELVEQIAYILSACPNVLWSISLEGGEQLLLGKACHQQHRPVTRAHWCSCQGLYLPLYLADQWSRALPMACGCVAEDTASYSLIPCAAEEWFRPLFEQNSKFGNPAKLKFRYSAH